jgi:biopolymer transport protein ExbB/TolQ
LLGAVLNGLWGFIGIASFGHALPLAVYAPGLAEASLVLALGLLTGVVAVICNWVVESRIDRAVLRP